ncbi:MAG: hypothetical protein R2789_18475 [Microthrixaceae bacterium]
MDAEPVVRRRRAEGASGEAGATSQKRRPATSTGRKKPPSASRKSKASGSKKPQKKAQPAAAAPTPVSGVRSYLIRPSTDGPKIRLGVFWFLAAVAALVLGRWAVLALWGSAAVLASWQITRAWSETPRAQELPGWIPAGSALASGARVAAAGRDLPGRRSADRGAVGPGGCGDADRSQVGCRRRSGDRRGVGLLPAMSVVLIAREEQWAALFLVVAVSFYDAGYFIGAAESSSRLEGPVTGAIGLLAVTFTASAFEAQPFDRATAWVAGAVMLLACPLGQMLTSAELPHPSTDVPAMRRLDSYLVAAPLMLGAVWALS